MYSPVTGEYIAFLCYTRQIYPNIRFHPLFAVFHFSIFR